ncbi:hypothetical protein EV702DRAFT_1041921 [Suillus placidus]|uniref:DUF6534 domain-containing protein n=1 Tax=Suillus placidus TaxID=48579 RepID=A0A9P7A4B2_9AGAM|nr:hypothetical protein EV702DRAFT_1041921 [Suillus placidus]
MSAKIYVEGFYISKNNKTAILLYPMSSVSSQPALGLDISQTYGAIVIGLLCAYFLYGATCVQTVLFFMTCGEDSVWIKCLCGQASFVYGALVQHFGSLAALSSAYLTWLNRSSQSLIIFGIQGFFLFRVYKSLVSSFVLVTLVTVFSWHYQSGLGLTSAGTVIRSPAQFNVAALKRVELVNDVFLVVTDGLLAGLMVFYLHRSRPSQTMAATETVISTLINYAIASGAFTATAAVLGFILRLAAPQTAANQCLYAIIPHISIQRQLTNLVYSNAMLASLNLRQVATRPWRSKAIELSNPRAIFSPNSATLEGIESQIHSHEMPSKFTKSRSQPSFATQDPDY